VNPDCSHCVDEAKRRAGELKDTDRVLCWIRGYSQGGAIPFRFYLASYRVISDTYGVFIYDPDAGFVRGFEPSLEFTFYGWRNGVVVMRHKDGTLYSSLTGLAFDGPNRGKQLKPVPTLETDWGYWLKTYPGAVAYKMYEEYQAVALPTTVNAESMQTRSAADPRLPAETSVLGIRLAAASKAYPVSALERSGGIVHDKLANTQLAVFWYAPTLTAVAYRTRLPANKDGEKAQELSFRMDAKDPLAPFVDHQTGSRWDITGRSVEGPLKGRELDWIDGVQVKWFAWVAEHPNTATHAGE
jgi:hypothetical protein